jgi:CHASE2 domain-containing sensor protein
MFERITKKGDRSLSGRYRGMIPGITIIGFILLARAFGFLQPLELSSLDFLLRSRPLETRDERITIIGIDETDIARMKTYPVPDREIAELITKIQKYQPRAIGLDIVRDIHVEPGHGELTRVFQENNHLIGIEKILHPDPFPAPTALPIERVGFTDAIPDSDGKYRRSHLGEPTDKGYKFSFTLRLAAMYLAGEGIALENGRIDRQTMRFKTIELPRFTANTGGYVRQNAGGMQILLNYRSGKERFRVLRLRDIKNGNFNPLWLRDRLIIIGITASSTPDLVSTNAVADPVIHGQIYGAIYQAHGISQIIGAVLDGRPLLKAWSDEWEYLWIVAWGIGAIYVGYLTQSIARNLAAIALCGLVAFGIAYWGMLLGWWLPIAPVALLLAINGVGLSAFAFYRHDRALRLQIQGQQEAIEKAFTAIHNRPLQQIALLSRSLQSDALPRERLLDELQTLNGDIREIFEHLKQDALNSEKSIQLDNDLRLSLDRPIAELWYEVYRSVRQRDYPNFRTIKLPIVDFQPLEPEGLTIEQKRQLCRFLEEALGNAGKYAQGMTRIQVTGQLVGDRYTLRIADNGRGEIPKKEGQGTKAARTLAKRLGGQFTRDTLANGGTVCELSWPVSIARNRFTTAVQRLFPPKTGSR